jgi:hypothetical protein
VVDPLADVNQNNGVSGYISTVTDVIGVGLTATFLVSLFFYLRAKK